MCVGALPVGAAADNTSLERPVVKFLVSQPEVNSRCRDHAGKENGQGPVAAWEPVRSRKVKEGQG